MKKRIWLVILTTACLAVAAASHAATFTVTKNSDSNDGACDADCSLREAVLEANGNPGADTVVLPTGTYDLTIDFSSHYCDIFGSDPCPWDAAEGTAGGLYVTGDLTIEGEGAEATIINQTMQDRAIRLVSGDVTIRDVTIQGGHSGGMSLGMWGSTTGSGAGILVDEDASLSLIRSAVRDNFAQMGVSCSIKCNNIGSTGGGIHASGTVRIYRSTISGNQVQDGGGFFPSPAKGSGICIYSESTEIVNSTISGNTTTGGSNAVYVRGVTAIFESSTLVPDASDTVFETSDPLVGIHPDTLIQLGNVIIGSSGCTADAAGQITSLDYNLDQDGSCGLAGANDLVDDPFLGPLQIYGGQTETHAVLWGSPAIDSGDPSNCPITDQTGITRPLDGDGDGSQICDRGAYEARIPPSCAISLDGRPPLSAVPGLSILLVLGVVVFFGRRLFGR